MHTPPLGRLSSCPPPRAPLRRSLLYDLSILSIDRVSRPFRESGKQPTSAARFLDLWLTLSLTPTDRGRGRRRRGLRPRLGLLLLRHRRPPRDTAADATPVVRKLKEKLLEKAMLGFNGDSIRVSIHDTTYVVRLSGVR